MKALVITRMGGPEALEVQQVPDPVPGPNQEIVQVEAGGLNFADVMTLQGGYPGTPTPPLVAGREFCGIRERDGQRVMGYAQWAAFAERTAAYSALLWPVPQEWSAVEGAAFPVNYFTAYFAYWKAGLLEKQGRTVTACINPCSCRRRGHRSRADWKTAGRRDVRNFFLRRKIGASERTGSATWNQLQAARLRRSDQGIDLRRWRGCCLRNARWRAHGQECALSARFWPRNCVRKRDRTEIRS